MQHHLPMEIFKLLLPYQYLVTVLTILILALVLKSFNQKTSYPSKLPPGPRKLPLIGNLHQLVAGGPLVHRVLADLAKTHGPLMHLKLGEVDTFVASTPEMAKQVMRTHDLIFANRPPILSAKIASYGCKDVGFAPHGKHWRQMRKFCAAELLSPSSVKSLRPIREEAVSNLIKEIRQSIGRPVNITAEILAATSTIISRAAFGTKCKEQDEFLSATEVLVRSSSGFCVADLYPTRKLFYHMSTFRITVEKQFRTTDRILKNIICERQQIRDYQAAINDEEETLLDVLLSAKERGEFCLEDDHIKAVLLDIFMGGTENSSATVEWAMSEMMKNPRVMKKAQDEVRHVFKGKQHVVEGGINELKYLKMVVKETLRLHSVAPVIIRENSERCEINDYEIPATSRIIVNTWAINRDPRYWDEAESFYPERFLDNPVNYNGTYFEYIPFGAGRRICPGILFGMPNVELPLAQLLFHFDWKLPNGKKGECDLDMSEAFGGAVHRKNKLILVPILPNSSPSDL